MKLSFITDEVTQNFEEAIRFAKQHGLQGLELRSVDNTPIDAVPASALRAWRHRLDQENLCVPVLASTFYKCALLPDAIDAELAKLERLCDAADILGCRYLRGFAFFAPPSGALGADALACYFEKPIQLLRQRGKVLLLEADPSVNTSNHATLAALLSTIGSPFVRAIFDPGNCLYDPLHEAPFPDGYRAALPYLCHVHIKDAVRGATQTDCVKVGLGQVNFPAILRQLQRDGYSGWLSMETHYRLGGQLSEQALRLPGGADFSVGGAGATAESIFALKDILKAEDLL